MMEIVIIFPSGGKAQIDPLIVYAVQTLLDVQDTRLGYSDN